MSTIGGWFASVIQARQAMLDLVTSGIPREDISVVLAADSQEPHAANLEPEPGASEDNDTETSIRPSDFVKSLADAGTLTLPDVGHVVVAGPIASAATAASSGAPDGSLHTALMRIGLPEDQARRYVAELLRGGALMAVQSDGSWDSIVHGVFRHSANPSLREQEERVGPTAAVELAGNAHGAPVSTSIGALTNGAVPGSWGVDDAVFEDQGQNIADDQRGGANSL